MAYPSPPDWNSAAPLSAWYLHRLAGQPTEACSTTGWDTVFSLQTELLGRLQEYGALPTYDGSQVDSSSVPQNDPTQPGQAVGWNRDVLRAMYAVGQRLNAPSAYLSAVRSDAESGSGPVSPQTFQMGIWIADRIYHGNDAATNNDVWGVGSPSEIVVPQSSILPLMDSAPPVPPSEAGGNQAFGASCNAIPAGAESLIPVTQTVVPFQFNPLIALAAVALAVAAAVVVSRDVPVKDPNIRSRRTQTRTRSNPSRYHCDATTSILGGL